jgi:hypothetical protein
MEEGRRTVSFGWIAGAVGMVEALGCSGLGLKALMHGISSPFLNLPRPYVDGSLSAVKDSLRRLGEQITSGGTPPELGPVTVVVSGKGRVRVEPVVLCLPYYLNWNTGSLIRSLRAQWTCSTSCRLNGYHQQTYRRLSLTLVSNIRLAFGLS